jgi:hypothetical protein
MDPSSFAKQTDVLAVRYDCSRDHPLAPIDAMQLKHILCQIYSDPNKLHGNPFSLATGW